MIVLIISQHGVAAGYYLAFFLAGFITTAGRLVRSNIRPMVQPAPGQSPTLAKRMYDFVGTLVAVCLLNYVASPFMLLSASSSFQTWKLLGYYGHVIIFGGLLFFYAGGASFCKGLQAKWGLLPAKKTTPNGSGVSTPTMEKNFQVPPSLDGLVPPESINGLRK